MSLNTLEKLYIEELRDLYSAENQLLKALPKMAKGASSPELKDAFEKHLEQTKGHVQRLEELFEQRDESPKGKTCKAMKGLIEEGSEILKEEGEDSVLDAGMIVAAQKVNITRSRVTAASAPSSSAERSRGKPRADLSVSTA